MAEPIEVDPYEDALNVARGLLAAANEADPGMEAATTYSSSPKTRARQTANNQHYAAYGVRTAVYAIFPELEDEPAENGPEVTP